MDKDIFDLANLNKAKVNINKFLAISRTKSPEILNHRSHNERYRWTGSIHHTNLGEEHEPIRFRSSSSLLFWRNKRVDLGLWSPIFLIPASVLSPWTFTSFIFPVKPSSCQSKEPNHLDSPQYRCNRFTCCRNMTLIILKILTPQFVPLRTFNCPSVHLGYVRQKKGREHHRVSSVAPLSDILALPWRCRYGPWTSMTNGQRGVDPLI